MKQHYDTFWSHLGDSRFEIWKEVLPPLIEEALNPEGNGNLPRWLDALQKIKGYPQADDYDLNVDAVSVTNKTPLSGEEKAELERTLRAFHPWRKGPFSIHDIFIDTEWHSDWKWQRVRPHLAPLEDRRVLDIGCGSGYHLWRMLGEKPKLAVGVDPSLLFMNQFLVLKHFIGEQEPGFFLPLTLEQLPVSQKGGAFDTVFSMGVLYHRRSPIDHILELKNQMRPGGELVLETLVVPESFGQLLVPEDRYAQMRNVWFLPSVPELEIWLRRCGFKNVRCVDLDQTSTKEQRTTDWMEWNSLESFLDPQDPNKTIEGYPAPLRAVMVCNKPQ
ncbi:tRNA 5-methoxyuridine(34)/uridine 5-oxyacetic acid(34) synthase CmoB [Thiomicrorhabdus xiamenensis]|uniref:tRNA U34 carboxymethyltransferase n=1 Tax=Thiomicrorhabdus xiamenensis TaxID=2739063 RepID=A0A7D4SR71_9GAMM|nr:tRNA 5-methoxyuridine(34)/uridine 5-oxyacetic acid(34) synthase CmoB [Thiomicrorhabdus xiamenensis]QKI88143.1 tRNA 5-methoxyuridine(34)/uridine 5-oxyacetic acid(34) synthase CmoB [Thiomicrorhabdus xiamenensis]